MALFGIFNKDKSAKPKTTVPYVDRSAARYELEVKANAGKSMSAEEYAALQRYRTRDVWDQVFKIAGVVTVLFLIMLAVFVFLYPYSLFNVFPTSAGKGDVFWKMLGSWHVYVGNDTSTYLGYLGAQNGGYVEMTELFNVAFQSTTSWSVTSFVEQGDGTFIKVVTDVVNQGTGFGFKEGFYVIGSWTIAIISTIGFVAAVAGAVYILVSNIRNLIGVIRHVGRKTSESLSALGMTAKDSLEEAIPEVKETKKKPRKKKEVVPAEEEPVVDEEVDEEADVSKRVEELKNELAEEEAAKQPKIEPVAEKSVEKKPSKYDGMTDNDIDRLLSGK